MGKKTKSVSIVTVTQHKRIECLMILKDLIKEQTYKKIIEWVIVEGSATKEEAEKNKKNIIAMQDDIEIKIVYVPYEEGKNQIGYLRNLGNRNCKGDIVVCMDDDDYYFPMRVEHAVTELCATNKKIAGCSDIILYDYIVEKLYKFKPFAPNHSTNACFAYKRDYAGKYDDSKVCAEEPSFTNNFATPMVQLDSYRVMVVNSHNGNTFNKRELLVAGTLGLNPKCSELDKKITELIPEKYLERYKKIFVEPKTSEYDIVFFMGGFFSEFDPSDRSLQGMIRSVIFLSSEFQKHGRLVAVYGPFKNKSVYHGVDYICWKEFPFQDTHNTVIMWRTNGLLSMIPFHIKAKHLYLDLHDGVLNDQYHKYFDENRIHKIFLKSEFHRAVFKSQSKKPFPNEKIEIIGNGIDDTIFTHSQEEEQRNPFRFCYTTCYSKGLIQILEHMWPIIFAAEPRSELHVYGGYQNINEENVRKQIESLLKTPGVMDHGRQGIDLVIREKKLSTFYLFVTNHPTEVDSISIKECAKTGCVPLLSNKMVYRGYPGIHFDFIETSKASYEQVARNIVNVMKQPGLIAEKRKELEAMNIKKWTEVATEWLEKI